MKNLSLFILLTLGFIDSNAFGQIKNIRLPLPKKATYFYSQVEPSIYINPLDTSEVIAGSVMNDYYYSKDGGVSWKSKSIKSKKNGVNGDPVMLIDEQGHYYYFHLSNIDGQSLIGGIVCERSNTLKGRFNKEGHTKVNGKFHDKQWVAYNRNNHHIYMTWTEFDGYDSDDPKDRSRILFSKSTDFGMTWSEPITISAKTGDCLDDDLTAEGAVPSIGTHGEIFVVWSLDSKLYFNVSKDEGESWLTNEIEMADQVNGWTLDIPGIYRCNGLPVTATDLSPSKYNGTLYVNWSDQRNGTNNTDIWIKKSTDGGQTWSKDIKVNQDKRNHHQFLSWMTIDQSNGYIYVVYYDRRNHSDNQTDVYLSVSKNGGESFIDYKISEQPFIPNKGVFFGDYTNISVQKGMIRPIWTRLDNKKISLYTAIISQADLDALN